MRAIDESEQSEIELEEEGGVEGGRSGRADLTLSRAAKHTHITIIHFH